MHVWRSSASEGKLRWQRVWRTLHRATPLSVSRCFVEGCVGVTALIPVWARAYAERDVAPHPFTLSSWLVLPPSLIVFDVRQWCMHDGALAACLPLLKPVHHYSVHSHPPPCTSLWPPSLALRYAPLRVCRAFISLFSLCSPLFSALRAILLLFIVYAATAVNTAPCFLSSP